MANNIKNVTFSIPIDLVDKLKVYVKENYIPSLNAGVKEALEHYTTNIDREIFRKKMEVAAQDPLFMKDLHDSMKAFEKSDDFTFEEGADW